MITTYKITLDQVTLITHMSKNMEYVIDYRGGGGSYERNKQRVAGAIAKQIPAWTSR
jgi:hypothetical protein